jgi:protein-disulfide isomerase
MAPGLPAAFLVVALPLFAVVPWWAALLCAASTLAASAWGGYRWWRWHQAALAARALVGTALIAAVANAWLIVAEREPALWPCDIGCAGGGGYRLLAGIPIPWIGCVGSAVMVMLAIAHPRPPASREEALRRGQGERIRAGALVAATQTLGWAMVGGSLFYLWTAWRLGMACRQCLAVHTAVLASAGPLIALPGLASARVAAVAAGFAVLLATYGPALRVDAPPPPAVTDGSTGVPVGDAWRAAVEAGRRRGEARAPLVLDVVIDAQCAECAETWPALDAALAPAVGRGAVLVVIRPLVRPSEPASATLADVIDCAAAGGPARHARTLRALLGTRPGISATAALATDGAQAVGAEGLARVAVAHRSALDAIRADDARWLGAVGAGRGAVVTPLVILTDAQGRELRRWQGGGIDPAAVAAAIVAAPVAATSAAGGAGATGPAGGGGETGGVPASGSATTPALDRP